MTYQETQFLVFLLFSVLFTILTWKGKMFLDHGGSDLMESIFLGIVVSGLFVMICHFIVSIIVEISK